MTRFDVVALPASEGDCLILSYGPEHALSHIVIDAGRKATAAKLSAYVVEKQILRIELLIVTHVDADHIEGMLEFLGDNPDLEIGDIWFNGYRHLTPGLDAMGPVQGEKLTALIETRPWNVAFGHGPVRVHDDGTPRVMPALAGGMRLTILSPDSEKLFAMKDVWEEDCRKAGLAPSVPETPEPVPDGLQPQGTADIADMAEMLTHDDRAPANGSSIAMIAEYGRKTVLLGADAHPDIMCASLAKLAGSEPVQIDLFKVAHHGSHANTTSNLMKLVECSHFLISTSGARFKHPDPAAIARLIMGSQSAKLFFNYRQPKTEFWETRLRRAGEPDYSCHFPDADGQMIVKLL